MYAYDTAVKSKRIDEPCECRDVIYFIFKNVIELAVSYFYSGQNTHLRQGLINFGWTKEPDSVPIDHWDFN